MLKSVANTLFIRVLNAFASFVLIVSISKYFGAEGKGTFSLWISSVSFVVMFAELIGGTAVVYLVPKVNSLSLIKKAYTWALFISLVFSFMWILSPFFESSQLMLLLLISVFHSLLAINQNILTGFSKFMVVNLSASFLNVLLLIVFLSTNAIYNYSIETFLMLYFGLLVASVIYSSFYVFNSLNTNKVNANWKDLFTMGSQNQSGHVLQFVSQRSSYYFLSQTKLNSALGVFSNAMQLMESVWLLANSISLVLIGKVANETDSNISVTNTTFLLRFNFYLSFLGILFLLILPSAFYISIFGNEFSGIKSFMFLLSPGILAHSVFLIISHHYSGLGLFTRGLKPLFLSAFISIVSSLFFYFSSTYSTELAAIICSASYSCSSILILIIFLNEYSVRLFQVFSPMQFFNDLKNIKARI